MSKNNNDAVDTAVDDITNVIDKVGISEDEFTKSYYDSRYCTLLEIELWLNGCRDKVALYIIISSRVVAQNCGCVGRTL
jgi:hypothetical protein